MSLDTTRSKGDDGEARARAFLAKKGGLAELARNWRTRTGELDLVMWEEATRTVVFVEVRSGDTAVFGAYRESIGPRKLAKMAQVARAFLDNWKGNYENARFDAVFIDRGNDGVVEHLEDIYRL